jgi:hypothetical protein
VFRRKIRLVDTGWHNFQLQLPPVENFVPKFVQSQIGHPWRIASQIAAHPLPESAKLVNPAADPSEGA